MAIVGPKTVDYFFPMVTADQTDAADVDFTQITITIEETTTRTFTSAILEVSWMDFVTATGGTVDTYSVSLKLGASAYTTITEGDDITHSGENGAFLVHYDFTTLFNTSFGASATQTCDFRLNIDQSTGTTTGWRNGCGRLLLSYTYDDSAETLTKTVYIPIESNTARLGTSDYAAIGTDQVPQLTGVGGLLPEDSVTIKQAYFVIDFNESADSSSTDITLYARVNSTVSTIGVLERWGTTERYDRIVLEHVSDDHGAAYDFESYASVASCALMSIVLVVTYTFSVASTDTVLNSLAIPFALGSAGGTGSGDAQVVRISVDIQEPTTIALKQSGVALFCTPLAGTTGNSNDFSVAIGSQTAITYNPRYGTPSGGAGLVQRLDSGSAAGAGVTINARGIADIDVKVYHGTQRGIQCFTGILYLNYTSGVAATGIASHNHTFVHSLCDYDAAIPTQFRETADKAVSISETNWYLNGFGLMTRQIQNGNAGNMIWVDTQAEILSNEGYRAVGDGWAQIGTFLGSGATETGVYPFAINLLPFFRRHSSDPNTTRLALETARAYRFSGPRVNAMAYFMCTYHSVTQTISGTLTSYTGDGSGITVNIHDASTHEWLYTATTAAGGTYSTTAFDDTRDVYGEARQDSTHMGRTDNGKAS
jgi:hypothetical protein